SHIFRVTLIYASRECQPIPAVQPEHLAVLAGLYGTARNSISNFSGAQNVAAPDPATSALRHWQTAH
ncbi:MAG: hypothetical protein WAK90_03135, partial [Pseudolabrys sp.]